jgi:hypothetical protein
MPSYDQAMASKASPTIANMQNKSFDPVGEVMAAVPGSMAPQPRAPSPQMASYPSSVAPTVPAPMQQNIPVAAQALAGQSAPKSANDVFGMMAMMGGNQGPQFSPVQTMGPTADQANGLLQLVQALKSRIG